jgi:hypothetical protein
MTDSFPEQKTPLVDLNENTSGKGVGATIPPGVSGWGWGPFGFSWIWGIFNEVWISFLVFVPFVNIVIPFVLGAKGRKWAWQARHWDSVESFNKIQRRWSIAALIIIAINIITAILFIPTYILIFQGFMKGFSANFSSQVNESLKVKIDSDVQQVGDAISACIATEKAEGVSLDQIYSNSAWDPSLKKGGCGAGTTLIQSNYISLIPSKVIITNAKNKICAYESSDYDPPQYASWDSSQGKLLEFPNGTSNCN